MTSVCIGCAHEQACGHAEVDSCASRLPADWCSCDTLRQAQAERDRYREIALKRTCLMIMACARGGFGAGFMQRVICEECCNDPESPTHTKLGVYCSDVLEAVDGHE